MPPKPKCRGLGPVVAFEPCPCGSVVELHQCTILNQTCARTQYHWEQSFDFRSSVFSASSNPDGSAKYTAKDHQTLVKCCESCIQNSA